MSEILTHCCVLVVHFVKSNLEIESLIFLKKKKTPKKPFFRPGSLYSITLSLSLWMPEEVWQLGFGLIACNSSWISLAKANSVNSGVDLTVEKQIVGIKFVCLFVLIGDAGKG